MKPTSSDVSFPSVLQAFFCRRLLAEQNVSPRTVASYRDTFRLLLQYAETQARKPPSALTFGDLNAELVLAFLDHLEVKRRNTIRSRNTRLAAIRSFMRYAALQTPESLNDIQRVLAIPIKRYEQPMLGFLSREEIQAIVSAPDRTTFSGHRDSVMFATLYNTGARVSEIIGLQLTDVRLDQTPSVHLRGKGRKERAVPLWTTTARRIKEWRARLPNHDNTLLFPNRHGNPLSRTGVAQRLRVAIELAGRECVTLRDRRISPHTLRHTTAMHLLQSGVDITVIALWLGHESPVTTHRYIEADLNMKAQALGNLQSPRTKGVRYHASDRLLEFLDGL